MSDTHHIAPAWPIVRRSPMALWIHFLLALWIVSMVTSMEFVLSQAMIFLAATVVFRFRKTAGRWRVELRPVWPLWKARLGTHPVWLAPAVVFLLVLVSGLWSSDWAYWLERLRIKSAFVVLPFVFAALPDWRREDLLTVFYVLLSTVALAALWVLFHYWTSYEDVLAGLSRGQHMPTPSNHIRFSLTVALAILGGIVLWQQRFHLWKRQERGLVFGLTAFLFVFIHVLSVRSGIVALYAGLFAGAMVWSWQRRRWWPLIVASALITLAPMAAYRLLPSFKQRLDYARWDWKQFREGKGSQYSDSERLASLRAGWAVWQDHFWLGVGAGDVRREVTQQYARLYPDGHFTPKLPHNQFLTIAAGTGLLGLLAFFFAFWWPAFACRLRQVWWPPWWWAFHVAIFTSFLVENTFESNYGLSLYLLLLLPA
ncbi:MAG: hypothetical protein D6818_09940, partial [Bacteroidetes bacterium]